MFRRYSVITLASMLSTPEDTSLRFHACGVNANLYVSVLYIIIIFTDAIISGKYETDA